VSEPILQLTGITFRYPGGPAVLQGLDLCLHAGQRLGLTGPNGSGKTTLLHLALGLLKPQQGTVRAFGRERCTEDDFHEVRRRAGLLFQDADDQLFCPTVLDDVAFGPLNLGLDADAARHRARDALETVGLPDGFGRRITYRLSGGEKRLVALAGVLAMEPDALLLDEPTAGLDEGHRARLLGVLHNLPQAMLIVSHDAEFLSQLAESSQTLKGV
jgi:cobalt/nickel transport system ATP-binding protein